MDPRTPEADIPLVQEQDCIFVTVLLPDAVIFNPIPHGGFIVSSGNGKYNNNNADVFSFNFLPFNSTQGTLDLNNLLSFNY